MPLPDDLEATAESQPLMEETPPQPQTRRVVGVASILLAVVLFAAAVRGLHAPNKARAGARTNYGSRRRRVASRRRRRNRGS
mmetsp:Transcript_19185/g.59059  ORF Transcript_19185/g.59059 Transcript_19185/m.59059 type:complete len:82 (-) Transcript_19185:57-302(-)